jgi:hypothetical protein
MPNMEASMLMPWRGLTAVAVLAALAVPATAQAQQVRSGPEGQFEAVTCTSGASCWAVGNLTIAKHGVAFIDRWNGSDWRVVPSQNPPKSGFSSLYGVSCAQAANCWAVGDDTNPKGTQTLPYAEHWNGHAWSEQTLPHPAHESLVVNLLDAVSCPAAKLCFADGGFEHQRGSAEYSASLIERWNGRSWRIVADPVLPHSTTTSLQGLSCASARDCWATGDWLYQPNPRRPPLRGGALGYHWNGHQWAAVAIQDTVYSKAGGLSAVSCPAIGMCMGTGVKTAPGTRELFPNVEQWNGSSWAAAPLTTSVQLLLNGVSCATNQMCMAAGGTLSPTYGTLAEQWNGSSWATVPSPNPAGADDSEFNAVSCPQVTNCWAVGLWYSSTSEGGHLLIEQWNGTAWTIAVS